MDQFTTVTHVIFDMDGLLLDTETLYTMATQEIVGQYGKTYTWEIKSKLMGLMGREAAAAIVKALDIPMLPEEYMSSSQKILARLFSSSINMLPGAERLIRHLHSKGVPIALATSSSRENFELKTQQHTEVFSLFNHIVTGSSDPDVKRGKPAPDIFLTCASRFPVPVEPHQCLVFEDAPNGVTAGRAAGMQVVMVPDARMDPLMTSHATQVLKSLEDFQPELFGLPSF